MGHFIGARMGRPEKAKIRKLTGSPQVLFPVGEEGGRLRCFQSALEVDKITADFPSYYCEHCKRKTIFSVCETCEKETKKLYLCKACGDIGSPICQRHGPAKSYANKTISISHYFNSALKKLKTKTYPDLIKGVKGTANKDHIPEHLVKGILRAKHDIYVNKDGTTRYDMSEEPITAFKPKEIGVSIEKLKSLGYEFDIYGDKIEDESQIVEIFPQDMILPGLSPCSRRRC